MNWNEYLTLSEKTLSRQFNCEEKEQLYLHAVIGSLTEIEEILENYQEGELKTEVNQQGSVAEESADIFWYLAILFRELNLDIADNNAVIPNDVNTPFKTLMEFLKENLRMLDSLKKKLYYNKEINIINFIDSTFKLYTLLEMYCKFYSADINIILDKNIAKLKARYGDKFSSERAINRDLETEKKILENG
jgi:NTP pyrophosphatase (non-canonical NTP hydrolase)